MRFVAGEGLAAPFSVRPIPGREWKGVGMVKVGTHRGGEGLRKSHDGPWLAETGKTQARRLRPGCPPALAQLPRSLPIHQPIQLTTFRVNQLGREAPGVPGALQHLLEGFGLGCTCH